MRRIIAGIALLALVATVGCGSSTEEKVESVKTDQAALKKALEAYSVDFDVDTSRTTMGDTFSDPTNEPMSGAARLTQKKVERAKKDQAALKKALEAYYVDSNAITSRSTIINKFYDPTNGTISGSEIVRIKE